MKPKDSAVYFQRSERVLGAPAMEYLACRRAIIFGLGGVGSWCAEALVRTGFRHLTLVDSDVICATNVNRQAQATALNIGAVKADELRARLLAIHPAAEITAIRRAYEKQTADQFDLAGYDYVVDAIDSLKNKVLLIEKCIQAGVKCYASMGAAAKLDPTLIRTAPLAHTSMCPLAKWVRKRLRQRGIAFDKVTCVYSTEQPREPIGALPAPPEKPAQGASQDEAEEFPDWCGSKARVNGALVHVTAAFGLALAGLVIRDCLLAADEAAD